MNDKYDFTLLREEAAAADEFHEKTHEHIADILAQFIQREKGGLTIGLEGPWGCGKSTIVNLLANKVQNVKLFLFDAWAHEGDCLRRIFLESLLENLISAIGNGELKGHKLEFESMLKKIDKREKITRARSHKAPTCLGIGLALSLLLTPFGNSLLEFYPKCGWLIVASPIFILLINLAKIIIKKEKILTTSAWSFVQSDSQEVRTMEVSEEEEKSSIEFERCFSQIMEKICSWNPNTRFIFAIDNLDRVAAEDSLRIWSTLQTFFQKRNRSRNLCDSWFEKLWIVVPYDPEGLAKIWQRGETAESLETKSFFDKCFQIRVDVPMPVMSDWEKFAASQIDTACSSWEEKDKNTLLDVLRFTRTNLSDIPTPREIKTYINQVCVLRSCACDEISTSSVAYYVIYRYVKSPTCSTKQIRLNLLEGNFPQESHKHLLPEEHARELAGLVFCVKPGIGQQLLLYPEISEAFKDANGTRLANLEKIHETGFWNVFEAHINNGISWTPEKMTFSLFLAYCSCIQKSTLKKNLKNFILSTESYLKKLFEMTSSFNTAKELVKQKEMFIDFIRFYEQLGKYNTLAKFFERLLHDCDEYFMKENEMSHEFVASLENVLSSFPTNCRSAVELKSLKNEKLLAFSIGLSNIDLMAESISLTKECLESIDSIVPIQDIFSEGMLNAVRLVKASYHGEIAWKEKLLGKCQQWFSGHAVSHTPENFNKILDILLLMADDQTTHSILRKILTSSQFYQLPKPNDYHKAAVLRAAVLRAAVLPHEFYQFPHFNNQVLQNSVREIKNIWTSPQDETTKQIWELARDFNLLPKLWEMGKEPHNLLFGKLIEYAVENDLYDDFSEMKDLIKCLSIYIHFLEECNDSNWKEKTDKFIHFLGKGTSLLEEPIIWQYSKEYGLLLESNQFADTIRKKLSDSVLKIKEDVFGNLIVDDKFQDVLFTIKKQDHAFEMEHEFYMCLKEITDPSSQSYKKFAPNRWQKLVELLIADNQEDLKTDITKNMINHWDRLDENFWSCHKLYLKIDEISCEFLKEKVWDMVRSEPPVPQLHWLAQLLQTKDECGQWKTPGQQTVSIENALESCWRKLHTMEDQRALCTLAGYFNCKLPQDMAVFVASDSDFPVLPTNQTKE